MNPGLVPICTGPGLFIHIARGTSMKGSCRFCLLSLGRNDLTALYSGPVRRDIDVYLLWNNYETDEEDVSTVFLKLVYRF